MNNNIPEFPIGVGSKFEEWRDFQQEAVQKIIESDKQIIFLEGPTGIGKSLILVSSYILGNYNGVILTRNKNLQDQYSEEFNIIRTIKGRNNFNCMLLPVTADFGPCRFGVQCNEKDICPYYVQREHGLKGQIISTNYPYFFTSWPTGRINYKSDMLSLDEAHLLDPELTNHLEIYISIYKCDKFKINIPDSESIDVWKSWASLSFHKLNKEENLSISNTESKSELTRVAELTNFLSKLKRLSTINNTWIFYKDKSGYTFKPVFPGEEGARLIIPYGKKVVFCSATILSPEMHLRSLGIPNKEFDFIQLKSPFPTTIRPVIYAPRARIIYNIKESELNQYIKDLDNIILRYLPTGNGIIHTHNYSLARKITDRSIYSDRMITYEPGGRVDGLKFFKLNKGMGKIFVAPSMETGVDFPYDFARWQILAKVPWPEIKDLQVQKRRELDPDWYDFQTVCSIVQTAGRIVRAPDDFGITIITDSSFWGIYKKRFEMFPPWFKAAVKWEK